MIKDCRYIQKKLSACQDGELDPAERKAVETHLHSCEDCRSRYESLAKTSRMLRTLPEIEPGDGFVRQLLTRIEQRRETFWIRVIRLARELVPMPAAMAAMAVAGILMGTISGNVLMEKWGRPSPVSSVFDPGEALTLASVRVFDAVPPDSFAGAYLRLSDGHMEGKYEN